jgi:hypothetical protein
MRALLVHGMGRSPISMLLLAARLRRVGITPSLFGYIPALRSFPEIVTALGSRLAELATDSSYVVVGHSLGGLLLRAAMAGLDPALPRPRHLFMLATPNQSPRLARKFQHHAAYRLWAGDAGQLLADPDRVAAIPAPEVPYTLVVGTSGRKGRWSPFADEPNDWIVSLSEARLADDDEIVRLPAGHTFLMNHREVAALIVARAGR